DTLSNLGAHIQYKEPGRSLPITIEAKGLQGGVVQLSGSASSQFISGLLLAAPYAKGPLTIQMNGEVVQRDYVEMTMNMMREFGIVPDVAEDGQSITVPQGSYQG